LVQIHRANVEIERAQRQFKKSASATPLQVAADKAFFGL
jgi:hypothetical protein